MQQAINLEKVHEPDIGYSEYKIRRSRYRMDVKFLKHSWLHPMTAGHEDERYEEVEEHEHRIWMEKKEISGLLVKVSVIITTLGQGGDHKQGQRKEGKRKQYKR